MGVSGGVVGRGTGREGRWGGREAYGGKGRAMARWRDTWGDLLAGRFEDEGGPRGVVLVLEVGEGIVVGAVGMTFG